MIVNEIYDVRNTTRVKNAKRAYEKAVMQSKQIEHCIFTLIEEKQVLLMPVVQMKILTMDRLQAVQSQLEVYTIAHEKAIDRVIEAKQHYRWIQKEVFENLKNFPHLFRKKGDGLKK